MHSCFVACQSAPIPRTLCIHLNHGKSKYIIWLQPEAVVCPQFMSVSIITLGKAVETQAFL